MKKKIYLAVAGLFLAGATNAQTVGDASLGTYNFNSEALLNTGTTSQYFPKVFVENGVKSVVWGHGTSGQVGIFHTNLDANYASDNILDTVIGFTGQLITDATSHNMKVAYDTQTDQFLSVYMHAENLDVVNKDFSMKAKIFSDTDFSDTVFYIEGPFDYTTDTPNRHSLASNGTGKFCVAYHSNSGMSNQSLIRVKMVDANTNTVTPAPTHNTQTGTAVTPTGSVFPSVAWNAQEEVFGIVYVSNPGPSANINFVSVDINGNVVTAPKALINDSGNQSDFPEIYEDGDGFVVVFRDFRSFQISPSPEMSGIPAVRICQVSHDGNLVSLSGSAPAFDATDNTLILSNPYNDGDYLYHDIEVITPREKYGVVWATQDDPSKVQFAEVVVNSGTINSMIPVQVNQDGTVSGRPSLAYDGTDYIIAYNEYNGSRYENRIAVGSYDGTSSISETESKAFSIYPNPSSDIINVVGDEFIQSIKLYDIQGKLIKSQLNGMTMDVSELENGMYIIEINGKEKKQLIKK